MFEVVYQWFRSLWEWVCPTRSSHETVFTVVDWDTGYSFPPANIPEDPLRSNHTSDPNITRIEAEPYAGSSTGAVAWDTRSDVDIEI